VSVVSFLTKAGKRVRFRANPGRHHRRHHAGHHRVHHRHRNPAIPAIVKVALVGGAALLGVKALGSRKPASSAIPAIPSAPVAMSGGPGTAVTAAVTGFRPGGA
jgi:hypothetical protein